MWASLSQHPVHQSGIVPSFDTAQTKQDIPFCNLIPRQFLFWQENGALQRQPSRKYNRHG